VVLLLLCWAVSGSGSGLRGLDKVAVVSAGSSPSRGLQETQSCAAVSCGSNKECGCLDVPEDKPVGQVVYEWLLIILLVALSALFSGLTLGLMSLDVIGLEIVIGGDPNSEDARFAKKIQPVRKKGNLLLCTLLLGNVAVNAALSILLADYTSGLIGFVASTAVIVIFGEILPQAACRRHALRVGASTLPLVLFFMVILYPLTKPLSMVLGCIFNEEIGAIYSSNQLTKLVEIHAMHHTLDEDQAKMMGGAIDYKEKTVADEMTSFSKMYMLQADQVLDFKTMSNIFQMGYSRIPVYEDDDKNKIVGLLFTKDLILIDPEDCTSVRSVIQFFGRPVHTLWPDDKLSKALALFRSGRAHLAIVEDVDNSDPNRDPIRVVKGLITLEDIIEAILREDIIDEADLAFESNRLRKTNVVDRATFDFARLRLLDTNRKNTLSSDEVRAIVAHLSSNLPIFSSALEQKQIAKEEIEELVRGLDVLELKHETKLYIMGKPVTHCTLVLSGKMQIVSGSEGFRSAVGPWSLIGQGALDPDRPVGYIGDFSATVTSEDGVRCIRINRHNFEHMLKRHQERRTKKFTDKGEEKVEEEQGEEEQKNALKSSIVPEENGKEQHGQQDGNETDHGDEEEQ